MAAQRLASPSPSNMGKSTTHNGRQPSCTSFRSCPTFNRRAPIASLTTFALSAPKNTRSPSRAPEDARDRGIVEKLHDRRLQPFASLRALVHLDVGETPGTVARDKRRIL